MAAAGPLFSVPAIGWVATKFPRRGWLATEATICRLAEPTSATVVEGEIRSSTTGSRAMIWSTGKASKTRSAAFTPLSKSVVLSTMPSFTASAACSDLLSTPMISVAKRLFLKSMAIEPPINPNPTTVSFITNFNLLIKSY